VSSLDSPPAGGAPAPVLAATTPLQNWFRETPLDFRGTVRRLWAMKVSISLVVAAFTAGSLAWTLVQKKHYRASITVSVGQSQVASVLGAEVNDRRQSRRGFAVADVFNSGLFAGRVGGRVNHVPHLRASAIPDSDLVIISAEASTPEEARLDTIEAVAEYNESTSSYLVDSYQKYRDQLLAAVLEIDRKIPSYPNGSSGWVLLESRREALLERIARFEIATVAARTDELTNFADPILPTRPFEPRPIRNGIGGAILGIVVGVSIAVRRPDPRLFAESRDVRLPSEPPELPESSEIVSEESVLVQPTVPQAPERSLAQQMEDATGLLR
jgi:hypothetical protein